MEPSSHNRIIKLLFSVSVVGLLAGLITTVRDLYLARVFGANSTMDTFFIILMVPMFIISITNSTLNSTLVPLLTLESDAQLNVRVSRLSKNLSLAAFIFMLILVFASYPLNPQLRTWLPELSDFNLSFFCFTLMVPLAVYSVVLRSALNARNIVLPPAKSQIIIAINALIVLLLLQRSIGIEALSLGLLVGYISELIFTHYLYFQRGLKIHIFSAIFSKGDETFYKNSGFLLSASILMYMTLIVDQVMASWLGDGDVSILVYSGKPVNFTLMILAGGISQVFLPEFSQQLKTSLDTAKSTLIRYSLIILIVAVITSIVFYLFTPLLVEILFGSSELNAGDLEKIQACLINYSYQFAGFLVGSIAVRFLHATFQVKQVCIIAGANMVLNVVLNYHFMQIHGVSGIALSTSLVYTFSAIAILLVCLRTRSDAAIVPGQ